MIPLAVPAQAGSVTPPDSPPDSPPEGISEWVLDFLAETYTKDGGSVSVSTVIDQPAKVDATDGLEILEDDNVDGVVEILGDLLTDLLTMDWTCVIEWRSVDTDFALDLLHIDDSVSLHYMQVEPIFFGTDRVQISEVGFLSRDITVNGSVDVGNHKIAITRQEGLLSASLDGGTVVTTSTTFPYPTKANAPNRAGFGGPVGDYSFNNCFIRRFHLMEAVADALLPSLST